MADPRQAVRCSDCGAKWFGRLSDACKVCVEAKLAEEHSLYPEFKGRP